MSLAQEHLLGSSKGFANRGLPGPLDLPQLPDLVERGPQPIDFLLPPLDAHLANTPWVAGDNFTAADIDLYVAVGFLGWIKKSVPEDCTHLLAWHEMLKRDAERLEDCRKRINVLPLGAAALAGTTFPIDRAAVAAELGFDKPSENSLDSVSDRDFII